MRRGLLLRLIAAIALALAGLIAGVLAADGATTPTASPNYEYDHLATLAQDSDRSLPRPAASPASLTAGAEGASVPVGFATRAAIAAEEGELAGSIRNVNPLGGTQNCVNCVIAGDATLAGRPATAVLSGPKPISVLERVFGGRFVNVTGRGEVAQMLEDAGPGARGIVYGGRAGGVGHVFNAVNQGGTIRFLDPQIGGPASFSGYDSFKFLWTAHP